MDEQKHSGNQGFGVKVKSWVALLLAWLFSRDKLPELNELPIPGKDWAPSWYVVAWDRTTRKQVDFIALYSPNPKNPLEAPEDLDHTIARLLTTPSTRRCGITVVRPDGAAARLGRKERRAALARVRRELRREDRKEGITTRYSSNPRKAIRRTRLNRRTRERVEAQARASLRSAAA